jgi:two-component system sensor histidine kinase KdpD
VAEARLRAQGEALREALLNSVSHDLRTPLATILGAATTLEGLGEATAPAVRRELAASVREEAERLAIYIENVLDLTRIRAGQIAPRLELVELSDIVNAALRRKQRALAAHRVEVRLPPDLPMLRLDLFLMEHALANALDNAAKYAPAGSAVSVDAARVGAEVRLRVADEGPGMDPAELPHAFEPFYRGAGAAGRNAPGSGLGLAICRAFVEANGGRVSLGGAGGGYGTALEMRLPVPDGEPDAMAEAADDD